MQPQKIIMLALQEDIGEQTHLRGDITTNLLISKNAKGSGIIKAKQSGVLAGSEIVEQTFKTLDPKIKFKHLIKDREKFNSGDIICRVEGRLSAILTGERTALNFLAKLSGIATLTNKFVDKVKGTKVKILDTRKTTPGLREIEKYAVKCGGGYNHRMGLWDMVLIKDNHIKACGGVGKAISKIKNQRARIKVEVEVKNLSELETALQYSVDRIMLDNMSIKEIKYAVARCQIPNAKCGIKLEVSGGVNLNNVRQIAETGIDYISIGALTHSAPAIDFSLSIV